MNHTSSKTHNHNKPLNVTDDVMIRVVVAQTTNHQAARVGSREFPAEPTVSESLLAIHEMKKADISTSAIAAKCAQEYEEWSRERLDAVLEEFGKLCLVHEGSPSDESTNEEAGSSSCGSEASAIQEDKSLTDNNVVAAILVFPEYGILREHCVVIKKWIDEFVRSNEVLISLAIFAGTHTLPDEGDAEKLSTYTKIGLNGTRIKEYYSEGLPTLSMLPIFKFEPDSNDNWRVSTSTVLKRVLSPFELTNDQPHRMPAGLDIDDRIVDLNVKLDRSNGEESNSSIQNVRILPLICSEALQSTLGRGERNFDVAVIPAYNNGTTQFKNIVGQFQDNGIITILCNDGKTGESGFFLPQTLGRGESGWFDAPSNGRLPPGDCMISADVSLRNLADTVKVNYSFERCRLQKLSAIVPRNLTEPSYLVAKCLAKLADPDTRLENFESRFDILQDCLDNRGLAMVQRRKIKRLLKLKNVSRSIWRFYGSEVYYGDRQKKDTPTFSTMEARLRFKVHEYCLKISATEQLRKEEYEGLREVISLLARPKRTKTSSPVDRSDSLLISYFGEFISDIKLDSENCALLDITRATEALVEDLYGASAYVFCNSPDVYFANPRPTDQSFNLENWKVKDRAPLKTVFIHHAPNKSRAYAIEGTMAGECVDTKQCIVFPDFYNLGNEATRPPFKFVNPNTRSAIAVPIKFDDGSRTEILGAIIIESPEANCFTKLNIGELQYRALELLGPLAFFRQKFRFPLLAIQWYPPSSGGKTQELYQLAIKHLEKRLQKRAGPGGASITLWERDPEKKFGDRCSAIATIGYSREYTNRRQLQISEKKTYKAKSGHQSSDEFVCEHWDLCSDENGPKKPSNWRPFTAYARGAVVIAAQPASHVGQFFFKRHSANASSPWRDSVLFKRTKKAERSQLGHVCCISINANRFFSQELQEVFKFEDDELLSTHVLSILTFSHSQVRVHDLLHEEQLQRLADLTGAFIGTTTLQLVQWARHTFRHQVGAISSSSVAANQLRESVSNILPNDGCSILAAEPPEKPKHLKFVSSSGLSRLGDLLGDVQAAWPYEVGKGSQHDTVLVLSESSKDFICKNKRFKAIGPRHPVIRTLESYTLSDNEHRKTLILRAKGHATDPSQANKQQTCAVIRLVRSRDSIFFSIADVAVGATLAFDVFRYWKKTGLFFSEVKHHALIQTARESDSYIRNEEKDQRAISNYLPKNDKTAEEYLELRSPALLKTTKRISAPPKGLSTFTNKNVDLTVRDLFFFFDRYQSVLSTLRVMKRARNGRKGLAVHSFHAHSDFQLQEEEAGAFIYRDEGGVGWRAINQNKGYLVNNKVKQFTRVLPEVQHETENAFCIPFLLPFRGGKKNDGHNFPAVLSIEWAAEIEGQKLTELELAVAYNACARIASSAYGPIASQEPIKDCSGSIVNAIKEFMASGDLEYYLELFNGYHYHTEGGGQFDSQLFQVLDESSVFEFMPHTPENLLPVLTSRRGRTDKIRKAKDLGTKRLPSHHGRHSVETLDLIRYLVDRRCKIVAEYGFLIYPLEFGGIKFGRLVVKIDNALDLRTFNCEPDIERYAEFSRSLDKVWFSLAQRIFYSPHFSIRVEVDKQRDHSSYRAFFRGEREGLEKTGPRVTLN